MNPHLGREGFVASAVKRAFLMFLYPLENGHYLFGNVLYHLFLVIWEDGSYCFTVITHIGKSSETAEVLKSSNFQVGEVESRFTGIETCQKHTQKYLKPIISPPAIEIVVEYQTLKNIKQSCLLNHKLPTLQ